MRLIPELNEALVAQALRHLAGNDALSQALDDRRFADARLADQDWDCSFCGERAPRSSFRSRCARPITGSSLPSRPAW